MKVAIVHDWLNGHRGGEKVLEAILELFPEAPIYTIFCEPEKVSKNILKHKINVSFLNQLPLIGKLYRHLLPVLPFAAESINLSSYDIVISSSHCVAKGVRIGPTTLHLCYLHAPMRYMWDRFDDYFPATSLVKKVIRYCAQVVRPFLQNWDRNVSRRVHYWVANSRYIAEQARTIYGVDPTVIYPFADLKRFKIKSIPKKDYYLCLGALAPYKRIDLAIEACRQLGRKLKVVGGGQELSNLIYEHSEWIEILGPQTDDDVQQLYSEARALIFPGKEDFGITPLEAMASGTPVIAFAEGGASETVDLKTGVFFEEQTKAGLMNAILRFEEKEKEKDFLKSDFIAKVSYFEKERFKKEFIEAVNQMMRLFKK